MELEELLRKLEQIDEQAKLTLDEFPKSLTKERLRMIIALVGYIKTEATRAALFEPLSDDCLVTDEDIRLRSV